MQFYFVPGVVLVVTLDTVLVLELELDVIVLDVVVGPDVVDAFVVIFNFHPIFSFNKSSLDLIASRNGRIKNLLDRCWFQCSMEI